MNYKQISILITVLPHVFAFKCLFAFLFFFGRQMGFFHEQSGFKNCRTGALSDVTAVSTTNLRHERKNRYS